MYASMTLFTAKPGMRERMERLADEMLAGMRQMRGFKNMTFVMDSDRDEYGGIALWESKEAAQEAMSKTGPKLEETLSDVLVGSLNRWLFEVYEPKA